MNDNNASTSRHTSHRPRWTHHLIWGGALAVAVAVGSMTLFLGASPDARAAAAGAVGGGGPGAFFAHMHGGGQDHARMHAHFDKVLDDAGVSEAQKLQIHAIMKTALADTHADLQRYHAGVGQLTTLLTEAPIDDAAIATLGAGQDRIAVATSQRLTGAMVAAARVLTPAQRVKLGADIERMMASHQNSHHAE
jgi:Spy/CpxP family protein refolding chaperone